MPHPSRTTAGTTTGTTIGTTARTRVKICGITRPGDAVAAACAGADAIGLVFYKDSPRAVTLEQAKAILAELPPFVSAVALFVNAAADEVEAVLDNLPIDLLQFHGDETPGYCASFNKNWLKAIRVRPDTYIDRELARYSAAKGMLLDAWHPGVYGGSGQQMDWQLLRAHLRKEEVPAQSQGDVAECPRIILAGGLNPVNVAQAIDIIRPWGVDVSSGVETAPGVKSEQLITEFMHEVQRV